MQVILFKTQGNVNQACNLINQNQRKIAKEQGYTVVAGGIVGKNAAGHDVPDAQKTERWDVAHPTAGGKVTVNGSVSTAYSYWIADPRPVYGQAILDNVQNWTEGDYEPPVTTEEV